MFREAKVYQRAGEPPRRSFVDARGHFDLLVWYASPALDAIAGFQLGYRPNPINTDDEYCLTLRPSTSSLRPALASLPQDIQAFLAETFQFTTQPEMD